MTHRPMQGVKVVELAQFTFTPASGGVLADWGADVIKVEHHESGDSQRGLVTIMGMEQAGSKTFFPIMEGPNRGKRSIGLDIASEGGREVLEKLIKDADVFVTNFREPTRKALRIEVEDVRAINPKVIYVRGTGMDVRGEDGASGGYDQTAYWARAGSADGVTPEDYGRLIGMPAGAYGDNIGGQTIAGGIAAALYAREATGEPSIVDVSLLSVGLWAMSYGINHSFVHGGPMPKHVPAGRYGTASNPLSGGPYKTSDGRWVQLGMLQPGRYWVDFCQRIGAANLTTDSRFDTTEKVMANGWEAGEELAKVIAGLTLEDFKARMKGAQGQWAIIQNAYEAGMDPQVRANGLIAQVTDLEGIERELVLNPVQFDETPPKITRGPAFAEHTDEILTELGYTADQLIDLKLANAVT